VWGEPLTAVQVPAEPPTSHASHEPVQARSQQYPSGAHMVPETQPPATVVQACPRLLLQVPVASHVPLHESGSSAPATGLHIMPAPGQVWQVPLQSAAVQQVPAGMQFPPHGVVLLGQA
jgi:hypothetical protein